MLTADTLRAMQLINKLMKGKNSFGIEEVVRLRTVFADVAGDRRAALNRQQFVSALGRAFPLLLKEKQVVLALFDAFDSDKSGDIDFKEFMLGLAKLIEGGSIAYAVGSCYQSCTHCALLQPNSMTR